MEGVLWAEDKPSRDSMNAVVKIESVFSDPHFFIPWQNSIQAQSVGSGVVISERRILTNAHNVANNTFVTIRKQNDDALYTAKIVAVDHECDLAILTVEDGKFFDGIVPFELGATPPTQSQVLVAGFPIGGDGISLTQGIISRIEARPYTHSGMSLLTAQIDAAINPGNSGGPALYNGKVVGIAFQGERGGESLGYIIPNEIIRHFLTDLKDGRVDGFGSIGFKVSGLDNPDTRHFLKMKPDQTGVLIYEVFEGLPKDLIKANDVLLAIDGKAIANNGNIRLPTGDPRLFTTLISEKQVGEKLDFSLLRGGKLLSVSLPVSKAELQVGPKIYDKAPDYYFVGGLVFTTLSASYLDEWGKESPPVGLLAKGGKWKEKPEDETIVLSQVLADKVNMGYQGIVSAILKTVNGEKVHNLKELISVIEKTKGEFVIFAFEEDPPIILDAKKMREATPRIMERYRVPADRSKNLM
jgi:S1-C subfamily serine protease